VDSEVQSTVARAATSLAELGCHVEEISLDSWENHSAQNISAALFTAEGAQYLAPIIAGREDQLAPPMQRRLKYAMPTIDEYLEAVEQCEALRQDVAEMFTKFDVLLCPVGPVPAHPHDSIELDIGGQKVPGRNALRATVPFDLTGSPALSVPFGWSSDGLPIGVQLVGRHFEEVTVLRAGAALEELHQANRRRPPV
jgi:aspartyl-tRNA(Asn)/glutamyl-tRNA(Gln) amidotransferase subunit A